MENFLLAICARLTATDKRWLTLKPNYIMKADKFVNKVTKACRKQAFVGKGAVVFIWTTLPYRAEWRYTIVAHKMIAMDAGHSCMRVWQVKLNLKFSTSFAHR